MASTTQSIRVYGVIWPTSGSAQAKTIAVTPSTIRGVMMCGAASSTGGLLLTNASTIVNKNKQRKGRPVCYISNPTSFPYSHEHRTMFYKSFQLLNSYSSGSIFVLCDHTFSKVSYIYLFSVPFSRYLVLSPPSI